eukprot:TRINITY_DN2809_c0_g2_i1.p1 TRINITY_DN2809_c0_g2~~TRINITY_DN2809_c0_g2_i1.p1  ORF type:complete len:670 (+),score=67.91 TRINITY_DN2809_c0_g2_i1:231-2012(+)
MQDVIEFGGIWPDGSNVAVWSCVISAVIFQWGRAVSVLSEVHVVVALACSTFDKVGSLCFLCDSLVWLWPIGFCVSILGSTVLGWRDDAEFTRQRCTVKEGKIDIVCMVTLIVSCCAAMIMFAAIVINAACRRRSICRVLTRCSLYFVVFMASYGLYIYVQASTNRIFSDFYVIAQVLQHLSGFLIVACYCLQSWYVRVNFRDRIPAVGLRSWDNDQAESVSTVCRSSNTTEFPWQSSWWQPQTVDRRVWMFMCHLEALDMLGVKADDSHLPHSVSSALRELQESSFLNTSALAGPSVTAFVSTRHGEHAFAPLLLGQLFVTEKVLHSGNFGPIELVRARADYSSRGFNRVCANRQYVAKHLIKGKLAGNERYAYSERDILIRTFHPGIVRLFAALKVQHPMTTYVLILEYCGGGDLQAKLQEDGNPRPLELTLATRYAAETLLGLEYLHLEEIVHRDIKPANILLTSRDRCKLADFGFAKEGTLCGSFGGTLGYIAPEVSQAGFGMDIYGPPVDIYSWGMVVMDMMTGVCGPVISPSELDEDFPALGIVQLATAPQPTERASIVDLKRDSFFNDLSFPKLLQECRDDLDVDG